MADIILKQANLSEIPLRILATLPTALPSAGYANLLCQDTADGKRAYLRLADGSLVNLFTENVTNNIDNTVDNTVTNNTTIYQIQDLPDPTLITDLSIPVVSSGAWGWGTIWDIAIHAAFKSHRLGGDLSGSVTLSSVHADTYISATAAATFTISSAVAWPLWCEIEVARNTTGAVVIAPSGVTINGASSNITISKQWGIVVLKNIGTNAFVAYGDIS